MAGGRKMVESEYRGEAVLVQQKEANRKSQGWKTLGLWKKPVCDCWKKPQSGPREAVSERQGKTQSGDEEKGVGMRREP